MNDDSDRSHCRLVYHHVFVTSIEQNWEVLKVMLQTTVFLVVVKLFCVGGLTNSLGHMSTFQLLIRKSSFLGNSEVLVRVLGDGLYSEAIFSRRWTFFGSSLSQEIQKFYFVSWEMVFIRKSSFLGDGLYSEVVFPRRWQLFVGRLPQEVVFIHTTSFLPVVFMFVMLPGGQAVGVILNPNTEATPTVHTQHKLKSEEKSQMQSSFPTHRIRQFIFFRQNVHSNHINNMNKNRYFAREN